MSTKTGHFNKISKEINLGLNHLKRIKILRLNMHYMCCLESVRLIPRLDTYSGIQVFERKLEGAPIKI